MKKFYYHGTQVECLPFIAENGLVPNASGKSRHFSFYLNVGEKSKDKVFVTSVFDGANGGACTYGWDHQKEEEYYKRRRKKTLDDKISLFPYIFTVLKVEIDRKDLIRDEDFTRDYYSEKPIEGDFYICFGDFDHLEWKKLTKELADFIVETDKSFNWTKNNLLKFESFKELKYRFIKEEVNPLDPYGEEDWAEIRSIKDVYVIYVIGQDMNFLCQKKFKIVDERRGWKSYYYEMAHIRGGGDDNFDSNCTTKEAYDCHNKKGVLEGTELVGYIEGSMTTRFDTLKNLCDRLRIDINSVKLYNGYN